MTGVGVVVTEFEQATGRLVLRCDAEAFERLREAVCREGGVFVPVTVPPTPVRAVSLELVPGAKPRPVGWARNLAALLICLFLAVLGPIGLVTVVRWSLGL
jgi:hypothetical protein